MNKSEKDRNIWLNKWWKPAIKSMNECRPEICPGCKKKLPQERIAFNLKEGILEICEKCARKFCDQH